MPKIETIIEDWVPGPDSLARPARCAAAKIAFVSRAKGVQG
jgi:hypothetical protein